MFKFEVALLKVAKAVQTLAILGTGVRKRRERERQREREMASRHLRKLRQSEDFSLGLGGSGSDSDSDDDDDEEEARSTPSFSAFALLAEEDGSQDSEDSRDSGSEQVEAEERVPSVVSTSPPREQSKKNAKKRKAKKKKKKKETKPAKGAHEEFEEDLDSLLQEFGVHETNDNPSASSSSTAVDDNGVARAKEKERSDIHALLSIDPTLLSPEGEMRRIFGPGAVGSTNRERAAAGPGAGRMHHRGHRGLRRVKKSVLFQPPADWPKPDIGLSMEHLETRGGLSYFQFKWSEQYKQTQERYERAAATFEPRVLMEFLRTNQYHLDTLLNLFYIYTHTGDFTTADLLLQRCIYALEYSFHPWFDVKSPLVRLEYNHETNQILFQVLFRYISSLSRQGCHRSALEVSKLLLSIDHSDPMGVLFCMDYHAIRAREYGFLLQLVQKFDGGKGTLSLYPNYAFSTALAKWFYEKDLGEAPKEVLKDEEECSSHEMLAQAIMAFPFVLVKLLDKLSSKSMISMTMWTGVLEHSFFKSGSGSNGGSASLDHLVALFVERQYELWKDSDIQSWMLSAVNQILEKSSDQAADFQALRSEIFPPSEVNEYRHIQVADFSDQMNHIPEDVLMQLAQGQGGPHVMQPQPQGLGQTVNISANQLRESNPLTMLIQSLMPWVSVDSTPGTNTNNHQTEEEGEGM